MSAAARVLFPQGEGDPAAWYRDAVFYEVHVRAFADSDGDGVGDFRGMTERLPYLQQLGVTCIWLLPFYPSPLKDDGYDIADYTGVHPSYGTLADFEEFLAAAHRLGLRVVTELVLNHTSDQHPWFERARRAPPGSPERGFYVWNDTPERYADARIIFGDFETSNWAWDPVAQAYYWHRFYSHQPDLNFESENVQRALLEVVDFWLARGVDGLRLDAVPYLYEREGTHCENLPETHAFLKRLRRHVDERFPHRMLLAEANQWPEDAVAYFGAGDECHMAFHFPLMPRLFMAIRMEDRFPLVDILAQTPDAPAGCQWALFLRNHDELTLEMVTDEERDYMYRAYAHEPQMRINLGIRRRLAPLLGNDRRRIELMNGLLFSLPGTPVLYYGDEIGMGDNVFLGDRNGVRTPMQWNADRNAGFSRASPQRLYLPMIMEAEYRYESLNVEAQQNNPHSLLWWMRRLIALRTQHLAFSRGSLTMLAPSNRKVLAFVRECGTADCEGNDESVLVVVNLSRYVQPIELDLAAWRGARPVELFGRGRFPAIGSEPYVLTLAPHSFFWLALDRTAAAVAAAPVSPRRRIHRPAAWDRLLDGHGRARLADVLPGFLGGARWFGGKSRTVLAARVVEVLPVPDDGTELAFVEVAYVDGDPETYVVPLAIATGDAARRIVEENPKAIIAALDPPPAAEEAQADELAVLYDAAVDPGFSAGLLRAIAGELHVQGEHGALSGVRVPGLPPWRDEAAPPVSRVLRAEQSNTSVVFDERAILKLFRRVEEGLNPEYEIGRVLTERGGAARCPATFGALVWNVPRRAPWILGVLQQYVPNQGDAWRFTLDALGRYFERVLSRQGGLDPERTAAPAGPVLDALEAADPALEYAVLGTYAESAALLGRRTAELHATLGAPSDDPAFAPEPFTALYQRSLYQSLRTLAGRVFLALERAHAGLDPELRPLSGELLERGPEVLARFRRLVDTRIAAQRIRGHGDFHLGQVLYADGDFVIIDFEGEPAHTLGERRLKRSPLRDVAGMMRSFAYAADAGLAAFLKQGLAGPADVPRLALAADVWQRWAGLHFLRAYLAGAAHERFLPQGRAELQLLLDAFLLEKAVYELGYELDNRPDWVGIPLRGTLQLLGPVDRP